MVVDPQNPAKDEAFHKIWPNGRAVIRPADAYSSALEVVIPQLKSVRSDNRFKVAAFRTYVEASIRMAEFATQSEGLPKLITRKLEDYLRQLREFAKGADPLNLHEMPELWRIHLENEPSSPEALQPGASLRTVDLDVVPPQYYDTENRGI